MDDILHHLPEFFGNHTLLVMIFVVLLLALIGGEVARLFRGYREVTPAALTLLINRENALVVDLSSTQDFDKGHIPSARNVQMSQFDPENKELAKAKAIADRGVLQDRHDLDKGRSTPGQGRLQAGVLARRRPRRMACGRSADGARQIAPADSIPQGERLFHLEIQACARIKVCMPPRGVG